MLKTYLARFYVFESSVEILDRIYRDESVDREPPTLVQIDQFWKELSVEVSTRILLGQQTQHNDNRTF
jgi:hypothetical protein